MPWKECLDASLWKPSPHTIAHSLFHTHGSVTQLLNLTLVRKSEAHLLRQEFILMAPSPPSWDLSFAQAESHRRPDKCVWFVIAALTGGSDDPIASIQSLHRYDIWLTAWWCRCSGPAILNMHLLLPTWALILPQYVTEVLRWDRSKQRLGWRCMPDNIESKVERTKITRWMETQQFSADAEPATFTVGYGPQRFYFEPALFRQQEIRRKTETAS